MTPNDHKRGPGLLLCVIPLATGFLFAASMLYLGVISTDSARRHYQSKKLEEGLRTINSPMNIPQMPGLTNTRQTPTPTPRPAKGWREKIGDYEPAYPILTVPFLVFGIYLLSIAVGTLRRNPNNGLMRSCILAMVCSFIISPALLMLYLWLLRTGLIA